MAGSFVSAELAPLGFGDLLTLSIRLYQERFATLLPAVALIAAPLHLASALLTEWWTGDTADWERVDRFGSTTLDVDGGDALQVLVVFGASVLLSLVAGQLGAAASLKAVAGAFVDQRPTWREAVRFATARARPLVALGLLTMLLTLLAALALVVPAIWLTGAWAVAIPVLLLEDKGARASLRRSRALVRGRWWPVAGLLALSWIFGGLLGGSLGAVLALPVELVSDADAASAVARALGSTVGAVLAGPFTAIVLVVLYLDLRVRNEGFNRTLLAATVGAPPPPPLPASSLPPPPPPLG